MLISAVLEFQDFLIPHKRKRINSQHLGLYDYRMSEHPHHTPTLFFFCFSLPPCSVFFSFPFPGLNEWKVPRSTMEAGLVGMTEMSGVSRRLVAMGNTPPMTSQTSTFHPPTDSTSLLSPVPQFFQSKAGHLRTETKM